MPDPILVTDLPWLLYRSFFGVPSKVAGAGAMPVNALLGTVNSTLAAIDACAPRAVIACTGAESAAYRKTLYPPYHAHRPEMPADLRVQWDAAPALMAALGWGPVDGGEYEADDVMLSLARVEAETGGEAVIFSGDRDMYGAVGVGVRVIEVKGREGVSFVDEDEVRRRYGVGPEQVAEFIALRGDPSDGIPGAPGIGEKTARELLAEYGSIAAATAAAAQLPARSGMRPRVAAALRDNGDLLDTFVAVAALQRIDVPAVADRVTDWERGAAAARELGMSGLAGRLEVRARAGGAAQ